MHAYAARDPVFLAMNKRGQRETHGKLGDFCIKCHAPMAVVDRTSKDGLDLERLPDKDRGVSCYFCHNVTGIEGDHNAMLHLANDTTMRGPIRDPHEPCVHLAEYSEMFEDLSPNSTAICGGCHDIVTQTGVHLERTLEEYRRRHLLEERNGSAAGLRQLRGLSHAAPTGVRRVRTRRAPAHGPRAPVARRRRAAHRLSSSRCHAQRRGGLPAAAASVSFFTLEVTPPDLFSFQIETGPATTQPSGAAQDRRMWLEFLAYDQNGRLLEQVSSGNIADGEIEDRPEDDPKRDPRLLMLRDRIYDAQGKPVHMFWQAAMSSGPSRRLRVERDSRWRRRATSTASTPS